MSYGGGQPPTPCRQASTPSISRAAIRGVNLFEYDPAADHRRIRVVGILVTDHAGIGRRGTRLGENFVEGDREAVRAAFRAAAQRAARRT